MTPILEPIAGRIHTIILAPVTAYVVLRVADRFFDTFVPRGEAEDLRVGCDVMASPTELGSNFARFDRLKTRCEIVGTPFTPLRAAAAQRLFWERSVTLPLLLKRVPAIGNR